MAWPSGLLNGKQQQSRVFFRLHFNVYTDVNNKERVAARASARDKKQTRRNSLEEQLENSVC